MVEIAKLLPTGDSLRQRIPLASKCDEATIVLKNGTLMSMINIVGAMRGMGRSGLAGIVEGLRVALASVLGSPGHSVEFAFVRDPTVAEGMIDDRRHWAAANASRLGLSANSLCRAQSDHQFHKVAWESVVATVWTRPVSRRDLGIEPVSGGSDRDVQRRRHVRDAAQGSPQLDRHSTATQTLCHDFLRCGLQARLMDSTEIIAFHRATLFPGRATNEPFTLRPTAGVKPKNNDDRPELPEATGMPGSSTGCELLDWQLSLAGGTILPNGCIEIGDYVFSCFDVTMAPETLTPFNELVAALNASLPQLRWRCGFMLDHVDLATFHPREQFAHLFGFASPSGHRRIRAAYEYLRGTEDAGDKVARLRIAFATWAPRRHLDSLQRNALILQRSVEHWGNTTTDRNTGDPLASMLATVPGLTTEKTAPAVLAPLVQLLMILPIARPACPWQSGETLFRSVDGKLWLYRRGSAAQTNWAELHIGVSGSGKSMAMNILNLNSVFANASGSTSLPRIGILDIGNSSAGLIRLIREMLPGSRQGEATCHRLKMLREHAINVFDTPPGMRRPHSGGRIFLINFLSVLLDSGTAEGVGNMSGFLGTVVDQCYKTLSDEFSPRRYEPGILPGIDAAMRNLAFATGEHTTWWQVVDVLFEAGQQEASCRAQTMAVPQLSDILMECRSPQVRDLYGGEALGSSGPPLLQHVHRVVSEAIRNFPILACPTRFSTANARILSIDLEEVTSSSSQAPAMRLSALMYMLARHAMVHGWAVSADEVGSALRSGWLPKLYGDFHFAKAENEADTLKILCVDEFHRVNRIEGVKRQIVQDIREGRKNNVHISLASQFLEDFPSEILNSATTLLVFSSQSDSSCDALDRSFGLGPAELSALREDRDGPGPAGARLTALVRTRAGLCCQNLLLDPSAEERWSFTTTREDAELHNRTCAVMDPRSARQVLALRFPTGTAKPEIERRLSWIRTSNPVAHHFDPATGIMESLVAELQQLVLLNVAHEHPAGARSIGRGGHVENAGRDQVTRPDQ